MATFSVRFLGCKVSHADAHAVREALLRDGHVEQDDAEIAVVNTCCVTHEAVRKSRHAAARAARTHRRVYVTGCAANLADDGFAGLPENVVVVGRRSEETPAAVARDVGAIGCVSADARLDRVRAARAASLRDFATASFVTQQVLTTAISASSRSTCPSASRRSRTSCASTWLTLQPRKRTLNVVTPKA